VGVGLLCLGGGGIRCNTFWVHQSVRTVTNGGREVVQDKFIDLQLQNVMLITQTSYHSREYILPIRISATMATDS
jgi:hypothetical protein